jgi:hypothetical protein
MVKSPSDQRTRRLQKRLSDFLCKIDSDEAKQLDRELVNLRKELLQEAEQRLSDKISDRTCKANKALRDAGKQNSAVPPFGWRHEDGNLIENESEQQTLCRIFTLSRIDNLGLAAIANKLGDEKLKTRNGKLIWQPGTIGKILKHQLAVMKFEQWERDCRGEPINEI